MFLSHDNSLLDHNTLPDKHRESVGKDVVTHESPYMTTGEAAGYLRRSESWLVKQKDIPYLRGVPNTYCRKDLDDWFEKHKFHPRLK